MPAIRDLTLGPPRSPRLRIRGYAILARTIDKCRATLAGKEGEYHFDCPVDRMLFQLKNINGEEFKERVALGHTDEEIALWLDKSGDALTPEEIEAWSDKAEAHRPYHDPEKREWFAEECQKLHLDPQSTTLFDYLEADDAASFERTGD